MPRRKQRLPDVVLATEFAEQLGRTYGRGVRFISVPAWAVVSGFPTSQVERVEVVMVRGAAPDYIRSGTDYAETADGRMLSGRYIFPVAGYRKPRKIKLEDKYGIFHDWAAEKRGTATHANPAEINLELVEELHVAAGKHSAAVSDYQFLSEVNYKLEIGHIMMKEARFLTSLKSRAAIRKAASAAKQYLKAMSARYEVASAAVEEAKSYGVGCFNSPPLQLIQT